MLKYDCLLMCFKPVKPLFPRLIIDSEPGKQYFCCSNGRHPRISFIRS